MRKPSRKPCRKARGNLGACVDLSTYLTTYIFISNIYYYRSTYLSVCLPIYLFACLSIYLSPIYLLTYLHTYLSFVLSFLLSAVASAIKSTVACLSQVSYTAERQASTIQPGSKEGLQPVLLPSLAPEDHI